PTSPCPPEMVDPPEPSAYPPVARSNPALTENRKEPAMPIQAKPLPFPSDALEPHIDKQTMETHHGKHYATYVNNYNDALKKAPQLDGKPLHEVLANNLAIV